MLQRQYQICLTDQCVNILTTQLELTNVTAHLSRYSHTGLAAIENALPIEKRGSKLARNSVFILNSVFNFFDLRSSIILKFSIVAYPV